MENARGRRIVVTIEGEAAASSPSAARRSTSPATSGPTSKAPTTPTPNWPTRRRPCRRRRGGRGAQVPGARPGQRPHHAAAQPVQRSGAHQGARRKGIGRPSTYASIIDTILARNYVFKKGGALVPTWVAFSVVKLLEEHLGGLVDYQFTAQMEDDLDAISRGERDIRRLPAELLLRQRQAGPQEAAREQGRRDRRPRRSAASRSARRMTARRCSSAWAVTRRSSRRASEPHRCPDELPPDEVKLDYALDLLAQADKAEEPLGMCPETNQPVLPEGRPLRPLRPTRRPRRRREAEERVAAQGHAGQTMSTLPRR